MIGRRLRGETMRVSADVKLPRVYVEPWTSRTGERGQDRRAEPPVLPVELRAHGFSEVELPLSEADATREARRCLRCDLEFTTPGKPGTDR